MGNLATGPAFREYIKEGLDAEAMASVPPVQQQSSLPPSAASPEAQPMQGLDIENPFLEVRYSKMPLVGHA